MTPAGWRRISFLTDPCPLLWAKLIPRLRGAPFPHQHLRRTHEPTGCLRQPPAPSHGAHSDSIDRQVVLAGSEDSRGAMASDPLTLTGELARHNF